MRYIPAIVLVLGLAGPAGPNDTAVYGVGGTVRPMQEHSSIRLIREKVDVKLHRDTADVRCEFVFKNEGNATTVKMGFPESGGGDISLPKKTGFTRFRSWVDGKLAETRLILPSKLREMQYEAWHVKDVWFGPGQTRVVVDEYSSRLGAFSDGSSFFSYTLVTGSSWKGPIGQARVVIDISELPYVRLLPRPAVSARRGGKLIWNLRDLEPKENIFVELKPKWPHLNGKPIYLPVYYVENGVPMAAVSLFRGPIPAGTMQRGKPVASVTWDRERRTCRIAYGSRTLVMTVGSKTGALNGGKINLPAAPTIYGNSWFVAPIAAVVEALGGTAVYDAKKGTLDLRLAPEGPRPGSQTPDDRECYPQPPAWATACTRPTRPSVSITLIP